MPHPWPAIVLALLLSPVLGAVVWCLVRATPPPPDWPAGARDFPAMPGRTGGAFPRRAGGWAAAGLSLGLLALAATWPAADWFGLTQAFLLLFVVVPVAVLDWRTLLVEVRLVLAGLALRLAAVVALRPERLVETVAGLLIGAGFFHMVDLAYETLRHRKGLGEGDAAVAALVGAFVGWQGLVPAVGLAALTGLVAGGLVLLWRRRPLDTPVPFAPFLGAAGVVVHWAQAQGWLTGPGWPL